MGKKMKINIGKTSVLLLITLGVYAVMKALLISGILSSYWGLVLDQALITTI